MNKFLDEFAKKDEKDQISFLMNNGLLVREMSCYMCWKPCDYVECASFLDKHAWRCVTKGCLAYRQRSSIRDNSFFSNLEVSFLTILKVLVSWCADEQKHSVIKKEVLSPKTYTKIMNNILMSIKKEGNKRKMGGPGVIVQIDETMMNYKCKSHRGRSPSNKTDALCIVEYTNEISWCYAAVIEDKSHKSLLPIILQNVLSNSVIHTDEHPSYKILMRKGFSHDTVCHKVEFINKMTGTHTQAIESFNNSLKLEIKKRKGVNVADRVNFLIEFVWKHNHRKQRFEKLLKLIKI